MSFTVRYLSPLHREIVLCNVLARSGCVQPLWEARYFPYKGRPSLSHFFRIPVHTIFDSCPEGNGIRSIAITRDSKFLATISDAENQVKGPSGRSL